MCLLEDYSDALGVIVICCFWRFSFVVTNFLLSILFNPWIDLIGSVAGAVLSIHVVTSFAWKLFFRFFSENFYGDRNLEAEKSDRSNFSWKILVSPKIHKKCPKWVQNDTFSSFCKRL